uniref:Photosystem I reaction center subunit PsaK n=1 Tax=Haptophyceae sp. NIES-3900 TaxID=2748608 RepID=A0A7R6WD43_9EUKA|nr:photosystem I reaction center subunit X [Haptophyceae sp. NIES-3900]
MNIFYSIALAQQTVLWSPESSLIMITCNVLAVVFGRKTIQVKSSGGSLPLGGAFLGLTLVELIATTCLGHIIGAGIILGFRGVGIPI